MFVVCGRRKENRSASQRIFAKRPSAEQVAAAGNNKQKAERRAGSERVVACVTRRHSFFLFFFLLPIPTCNGFLKRLQCVPHTRQERTHDEQILAFR